MGVLIPHGEGDEQLAKIRPLWTIYISEEWQILYAYHELVALTKNKSRSQGVGGWVTWPTFTFGTPYVSQSMSSDSVLVYQGVSLQVMSLVPFHLAVDSGGACDVCCATSVCGRFYRETNQSPLRSVVLRRRKRSVWCGTAELSAAKEFNGL